MAELNFSIGVKSFTVNGVCTISFNPTDSFFVERLFNTFDALDKKQEKFRTQIDSMTDNREIFKVRRQRHFRKGRLRRAVSQHERLRHGRWAPGLDQLPLGGH